ncbi:hypothetical protein PHZ_c0596 [Phenylobacterium zucineum HLK1]|uniref:Uncharacterized protein n=1 Tax=Phenylobacterium zucineum (strain HLK1) TaxID=450851 RepID=B4RF22_PHEZH|nr:hypothetical protein [Phenylobacterium zucineum]ACG77010.1 hypothetical protein PHZ_c0596 [Phenylobacterium zucineum HLK1]
MSMDHTGMRGATAPGAELNNTHNTGDAEGSLFAPIPAWERGKKRKGLGRGKPAAAAAPVAAEPRSFDSPTDRPAMDRPAMDRPMTETRPMTGTAAYADEDAHGEAGLVAPIGRTRTRTGGPARKSGMPAAALAAGVVALGAVGAAGWYVTQQDDGVAELTPAPATESLAIAQNDPMADPMMGASGPAMASANLTAGAQAAAETPPASEARVSETRERAAPARTASAPRVRSAAAPAASATEAGINASGSAALPDGPQPYSALNPQAQSDTATTVPETTAPQTTAPAIETPAPLPATPPVLPDASPEAMPTPAPGAAAAPETPIPPQ